MRNKALLILLIGFSSPLLSQQESEEQSQQQSQQYVQPSIGLTQLLNSARQFYPKVLAAQQQQAHAKAQLIGAEGGYDWQLDQALKARTSGYYDGVYLENKLTRPLPMMNAKVFAQYRISDGDFPIYEQDWVTQDGGEASIGLSLSLLQGRKNDERRFQLEDARLELALTGYEQLKVENRVLIEASTAYMSWLLAARQQEVYRNLLKMAELQQKVLRRRVSVGDSAEVDLLDQQQELIKRRSQLLKADNALLKAATQLSLYWRDDSGRPIRPDNTQVPTQLPNLPELQHREKSVWLAEVIEKHPQLQAMQVKRQQLENKRHLHSEELLPKLDFSVKLAQDLGNEVENLNELESVVGLQLSVPLQRRQGKAKVSKLEAEIRELDYRFNGLAEQLRSELENGLLELHNSIAQAELAQQQVTVTDRLRQGEYQRFEAGASDMFRLNIREQMAARAQIDAVSASLKQSLMVLELLGLSYQIPQYIH